MYYYKKGHKSIKRIPIIMTTLIILLVGLIFVYQNNKANEWMNTIIAPDALTVRTDLNGHLIEGTGVFEGEAQIDDKEVIYKIISMINEGKYLRMYPESYANNFNLDDISFSIGTVVYNDSIPINAISTVNIFKNGTFIASKKEDTNSLSYVKGKLGKEDLEYLDKIYKNSFKYGSNSKN